MLEKSTHNKSNKEIHMLILIMPCFKPELIKTVKHWNLRYREIIGIAESEKWPRNQDNLFYDKSGISNQQWKNGLFINYFRKIG